jgi:hypothetical protein
VERTYPAPQDISEIEVSVEDLDSAISPDYVPDLIKIDVEGAEEQVISGALRTITRYKPLVVFEHGLGAADHYGTRPADIYGLLCDRAGLRVFDLDGNGPYDLSTFEAEFQRNQRWNFVAHR